MIPADETDLHALAGEYVLGTLDPAEAAEVEAALPGNAALRQAVAFWEERLHGLAALAPPAEPPPGTWNAIAERIAAPAAKPAPSGLWNSLALWRASTAVAAAAAACLALYIALVPAGPSFVAVLHAPQQGEATWIATAGSSGMLVRAVVGGAPPADRAFELWTIPPGATRPQSLGVIPPDGRIEFKSLPPGVRDGATLAISIEPKGGSPTGQPTGPVVYTGALTRAL